MNECDNKETNAIVKNKRDNKKKKKNMIKKKRM